ncbi:hypothetical protein V3C99_004573 [Haemonchus contortus]|uniref:Uncharacterized protein n=1 Tax=Haemonchus contortus TaxID=6289 RepID=A0A7I4XXV5_HAECO
MFIPGHLNESCPYTRFFLVQKCQEFKNYQVYPPSARDLSSLIAPYRCFLEGI